MIEPLELKLHIKLTPLRHDPVTEEMVVKELVRSMEEMDIRVEFMNRDKGDESVFFVEFLSPPQTEPTQ